MLQANPNDERVRVWRLQRELVQASLAMSARTGEKQRRAVKGADRRDPGEGFDRP